MHNHMKKYNPMYTVVLFFIVSTLIFTTLVVSNGALAQPSNFNKLSKADKCAARDLPPSACKKYPYQSQAHNGGVAAGQTGNSAAEQETEQGQTGDTGAQSVSPELNALTGNNLGVEAHQNGECIPTFEQPPTDSTISRN